MTLNAMNLEYGMTETRRDSWKASSLRNGLLPGTGLAHEAVCHNGWKAGGTATSGSTPAATPNASKPQRRINGYINHGYRGKGAKAVPPSSPASHGPTAGKVRFRDTSENVSVNGSTSRDVNNSPSPDQVVPQAGPSAADSGTTAAKKRRMRKYRRRKRDTKDPKPPSAAPEESEDWEKETQDATTANWEGQLYGLQPYGKDYRDTTNPKPPSALPEESEDWEKETQDVTIVDLEGQLYGLQPYGPEDLLPFALRDLTLHQRETFDRPLTARYSPSIRHPHPMTWKSYRLPTEPGQFADADE